MILGIGFPSLRYAASSDTGWPASSPPQRDRDRIAVDDQPGAERRAAPDDRVKGGGLVGERAQEGVVALVVPDKAERGVGDAGPCQIDRRHHAEPVAVPSAAVAGVKREAAEPVEDRPF